MTRSRLLLPRAARRAVLLGALALGAASAPAPAAAQPPVAQGGDTTRARDLFKKGREEYAKDRLPQAYALFIEAWGIQKTFDIAGNLALVENQLTRYREAAEHATYALANFPAGGTDAQRKSLQDVLTTARGNVGTLTLRVSVDHAAVTLDNLSLGESPFHAEIFVDPGAHTLVATAPGCEPARDTVRTDKGSTHLVTLTLGKCGGKGPTQPPLVVETAGPRPLTVAGFIVTGLGLGLGTAFAILSKTKASDASEKLQAIQTSAGGNAKACAEPSRHDACAALAGVRSSEATFANAALWTFIAATAVGAGTIAYALAVPSAPPAVKAGQTQLIPVLGPGTGGVMLKGAF